MSPRRRRLLAAAASLVVALVAAEVVTRAVVGTPLRERLPLVRVRANPYRGWGMVPGHEHYTYQHRVHVNRLGLRGPEPVDPPAGPRVLFLGDSLTYGQGVGDDATVPAALQRALRARDGRAWEVLNGGHRAYGTAQELGMLDELGPLVEPEVVVLGWYWNDVSERPIEETYAGLEDLGDFVFDTGDAMEGWSLLRWRLEQVPQRSALVMLLYDLLLPKETAPFEVADEGFARLGPLLERFRDTTTELGARPVVAILPDSRRLDGDGPTVPFDERCLRLAEERGLPVVELRPPLERLLAETGRLPILPFDGHYDAAANEAMGAWLAEEVLALVGDEH